MPGARATKPEPYRLTHLPFAAQGKDAATDENQTAYQEGKRCPKRTIKGVDNEGTDSKGGYCKRTN